MPEMRHEGPRSPLLRVYAEWTDRDRRRIVKRRSAATAVVVAIAGALTLLVRSGRLPEPTRHTLYWFHDHAVLPFWGYGWSLFAPFSAIWWSLSAIVFVVWLATFLTRRSVIRGPHARLARRTIRLFMTGSDRSARRVVLLTAWVDWLGKRGLGAALLREVARLEYHDALVEVVVSGQARESSARRLVRLTELVTRLMSGVGTPRAGCWRALAVWHQALMWIDRGSMQGLPAEVRDSLMGELAATGTHLLERLESSVPAIEGRAAAAGAAGESAEADALPRGLQEDLQRLIRYAAARTPDEGTPEIAGIMRSTSERLDDFWAMAEHTAAGEPSRLTSKNADSAVLEALGVLTSSIGLHAAWLRNDVHRAIAWLNAFEAVGFVQYIDPGSREHTRVARGLTSDAPQRDHYRFACDMVEAHAARLGSAPGMPPAVREEAVAHERILIDALSDAAGPDFDRARAAATGASPAGRWRSSGRDLRSRIRHDVQRRPIPLRQRVDPIVIAGSLGAACVYAIAAAGLILVFGSNDPASWSGRSLPDRRILENVRRDLGARPFLDAVFHSADRQLVISQVGSTFHSFDPATALWTTARPFKPGDLTNPDVRLLASSPDSEALWGLTADGGLVRRLRGRWDIVIGDVRFIGSRGTPVQHADLAAIAVSPDGRWLVAGAGGHGVGIQDVARRRWLTPEEVAPAGRPSVVTHAAWWRDRFYVGGPEGVSELAPDRQPRAFRRVEGLAGSVVALEPTVNEGLFVLQTVPCGNGPRDCTRLSVVNPQLARPTVLIDERNRYPEMTLDRTLFVEQWDEHLVLAGAGGIFDYDTQIRSWNRLAFDTITAVGSCRTARCFYFGYAGRTGGVGLLTPKTLSGDSPVRWLLPGEQPARIAARAEGPIAVLAASGRAYALGPGQPPFVIHPGTSSAIPFDRFRNAVTFGDTVLLFGANGAVLHDVSRRSYRTLTAIPAWLRSSDAIVRASGAHLFGLERRGQSYAAHVVPQRQVELGTLVLSTAAPAIVEGPITGVDASSPDTLRVIDGPGRVVSIAANGAVPMTGGRVAAIADARPLDVAGSDDSLAVATTNGVRIYSSRSRSWTEPVPLPTGEQALEVARRGSDWLARSRDDRLLRLGAKASVLIGGDAGAVPAGPLTDVLARGNSVYLAWAGGIARYDMRARQIASRWPIDSSGPVRVGEIASGEPVSLAAGVARIGSREIARGVQGLFVNGANLWLTREDRGRRYLEVTPVASISRPPGPATRGGLLPPLSPKPAPTCLFRDPTAGADVTELRDARALPNGLVAVTTNAGLKLYSRPLRSWYGLEPDSRPVAGRGRLHSLGSTLLVADAAGALTSLRIVRSGVRLPDSCAVGPARFERPPDMLDVRSMAVDERRKRAVVLRPDGAVDEITESGVSSLLSAPGDGPREADIARAWHFPDVAPSALWVATSQHLWRYDLTRHTWLRLDLSIEGVGPLAGEPIELQPRTDDLFVVATRDTGARYGGALPLRTGDRQGVTLLPLAASAVPPSGSGNDRRSPSPVFTIGAVTFFREVHHGMLAVLRTEDGRSRTAYRAGRFLWDSGRRGLAIADDTVLIHSDAGVHPLASLASFDPGPAGPPDASDRLEPGDDLTPRFPRGGRQYRRSIPGVWEADVSPRSDAVVLRDEDEEWIRRNGVLTVESIVNGRRAVLLTANDGVGLAVDRLVSAAAYGGQVYVLSQGFLDIANPSATGQPLAIVVRAPAPPGTSLERLSVADRDGLWLTSAGSVYVWNDERRVFEPAPPGTNPYQRRRLAEAGPLRFELDAGVVTAQLRTEDPQGNPSWKPVAFEHGRFAFDVVRSIATPGSSLFVGTDAGLQVYEGIDLGLDRARFVSLDTSTSPSATPVDRMGEPCTDPGGFVACSRTGCFQPSFQRFVATAAGDALACRVRARSSLWSWTADAAGVTGRYTLTGVSSTAAADSPVLPVMLRDGRFPHDAITQVVAFDSKLFTVWQGNQVGVHGADLRLTPEVRNHQFAAPVRLVLASDRVQSLRTPEREFAPSLYALEGPRVWKYGKAAWLRVADTDEIETIADYDANRPILQRRRLRLVRRGRESTLGFEMRMPGTPWTPLQWDSSANRFAVDVWQNIELSGDTLWVATPAGFVGRDGDWTFDPNAFRFVDAVPAEAGRAITDLRIDGASADVRYDGDSTRIYRVVLDEHGGRQRPGRFARRDGDPFREQPFAVDHRYWSWGITGRSGTSVGRLVGTWKGEPIGISNGRFDFDSINSMAVFKGQLHVATTRRGWFESPAASAALDRLTRPDQPAIAPADVTMVYDNRDPKQRELCLRDATGQFVRLSEDGATRRTQGCPILAADTPFWRYTRDGAAFRMTAAGSGGKQGERRLVDGRFTDEVVIGPPVAGSKDDRRVILVPTTAGVMSWSADGRTIDMHAPPFQGKPETPRLLTWAEGQPPAYVADGTLYSLEVDEKPRGAWTARIPPTGVFERFGSGPGPLLWLDWSDNARRHHTIVDPRNNSVSHDEVPVDARKLPAYFRRAMMYQAHDGLIRLRLRDKVIQAYAGTDGWPIAEVDDSFQLLGGAVAGTRAVLVGPHHLIELNMDKIARAVYSGEKPKPPAAPKR